MRLCAMGLLLDGGIDLGVGAGLFHLAGRGRWVRPALAIQWAGRRRIFEADWEEDRSSWVAACSGRMGVGACKNLKGEMMGYIL